VFQSRVSLEDNERKEGNNSFVCNVSDVSDFIHLHIQLHAWSHIPIYSHCLFTAVCGGMSSVAVDRNNVYVMGNIVTVSTNNCTQ